MEKFITDQQTSEELNLFGRFRTASVFSLFNRTVTRGGEQVLEKMLRRPFTEAAAIKKRAAIFSFFQRTDTKFPFDEDIIEVWVDWLAADQPSGRIAALLSALKRKWMHIIAGEQAYERSVQGIKLTARVLSTVKNYIETQKKAAASAPTDFMARLNGVENILEHKLLAAFYTLDNKRGLTVLQSGKLAYILKNVLGNEIASLVQFIYEVDAYTAVGVTAGLRGFTSALIADSGNILRVKGLRHPALDDAVGNDLELSAEQNFLFLTGANMAGKSTLMKSIGTAMYLAHAGFPVAADEMVFSIKDGLYTSINIPDNINLGYSHFYAEVLRVKNAAALVAAGKNLLIIFDELFKGTNVKDAYEGTLAVSQAFLGYKNCLFVISTHIIEVGEVLALSPFVNAAYMPTIMKDAKPVYTYKLAEGITKDRQGMLIIQNENILGLLQ